MCTVFSIAQEEQVLLRNNFFVIDYLCFRLWNFTVQNSNPLAELISPEDLLQACALWEKFDVYAQLNLQPFSGSNATVWWNMV